MKSLGSKKLGLTAAFSVLLLVLGMSSWILFRGMAAVRGHQAWVVHTEAVLRELEETISLLKDAETGQRGFALTGDPTFLAPFDAASRSVLDHVSRIQELTVDNQVQQANGIQLRKEVDAVIAWQKRAVDKERQSGQGASAPLVARGEGRALMDSARGLIADMEGIERRLLAVRTAAAEESSASVDRSFLVVTLVDVLLLLLAHYFVRRSLHQQELEQARLEREGWLSTGLSELSSSFRDTRSVDALGEATLAFFSRYAGAHLGTYYVAHSPELELAASLGTPEGGAPARLAAGVGLAGAAVSQGRVIEVLDVPASYLRITSTLGEAKAGSVLALPLRHEGQLVGALELAWLGRFDERQRSLVEAAQRDVASSLSAMLAQARQQALLEETQRQAEELTAQQEELRTSNEELETRAVALRASQDSLQTQQEELRQINEELEQQSRAVEAQAALLTERNLKLEAARQELEAANQYKSEFLANMSHELRTPLNSLLILASLLAENRDGSLSEKYVDFARTIQRAGQDLLLLINDILDLAKVEAGRLEVLAEDVTVASLGESLADAFRPVAEQKGLDFRVETAPGAPAMLRTDRRRLEQILRNLLSNAFKFTDRGGVTVTFAADHAPFPLVVQVKDSGIGIPEGKQGKIFEAFEQVDSSTSRAYGGTGLGLTISRELARLLGGRVTVASRVGEGSTFSLHLPADMPPQEQAPEAQPAASAAVPVGGAVERDAADLTDAADTLLEGDLTAGPEDRVVLVIEDDRDFGLTVAMIAREAGFKAVLATTGASALAFARKRRVTAILLDVKLPDVSGMSVLERFKRDPATRHVPIHMLSGLDYAQTALSLGAMGYLVKPVDRVDLEGVFQRIESVVSKKIKHLLIVEDDARQRSAVRQLLGDEDVVVTEASSGAEALTALKEHLFDCMVLDLRLPDMSGFELLERLGQDDASTKPPVVVYTGKDLSRTEYERLQRYADSIVIKGAKSPERLLDEVSLFLHRLESSLPLASQQLLERLRTKDLELKGRKILLVDDDIRNIFALVNALDLSEVKTVVARNGREALDALAKDDGIELVLMDIMMPVMNGYEATRAIRADARHRRLPIIALTAKAMKGDQEKCLAAGANDYLPKPVEVSRLTSLLKVWLPPRHDT